MRLPARPTLLGVGLGVVGLLAVLAFAVLLPHTDDGGGRLPETLPHGLRAVDLTTSADVDAQGAARVRQLESDAVAADLEHTLGVHVQARGYSTSDPGAASAGLAPDSVVEVVEIATPPGPFVPDLQPEDRPPVGQVVPTDGLARVGDAVCVTSFSVFVLSSGSSTAAATTPPTFVNCQLTGGSATWRVQGTGLSSQDAVEALDAAAGR